MKKPTPFEEVKALRKKQRCALTNVYNDGELFDKHTNELLKLAQTFRQMTAAEQKAYWSNVPVRKVKVGTVLIADSGFTCMKAGERKKVFKSGADLCVHCKSGEHLLDGQLSDDGKSYVGFFLPKEKGKK